MIVEKITIKKGTKLKDGSLPDIDSDFLTRDRVAIKEYIENRFGKKQVCSVGAYTTLKIKSTIKDLARIASVDFAEVNLITSIIQLPDLGSQTFLQLIELAAKEPKVKQFIKSNSDLFYMLPSILNQPKTKSIHPCAVITFPSAMTAEEWSPMRHQQGQLVSEWTGSELDEAGFLKNDVLGINQLDKLTDICNLIEANGKEVPNIFALPEDKEVYRYYCNGWNSDVFQMKSTGLSEYCKAMKPMEINDLVATTALYRPGPMGSGYHTQYAKCKNDGVAPKYLWGTEEITKNTFGLLIYQEQIMEICKQVGGLDSLEADSVRKAMGKKKLSELLPWKERVLKGYLEKGATEAQFLEFWDAAVEFAQYAFNKCISGDEKIYRPGVTGYNPTIGEMWNIKNSREYAASIGKIPLYEKYNKLGYGSSYSLDERKRLIKNKIIDIRFEGVKDIYRMTLSNGKTIDTTLNHKFPTSGGEKKLEDIDISKDMIYFNVGYKQETHIKLKDLVVDGNNIPKKGQKGFQKRDTPFTKLRDIKKRKREENDCCEICESKHRLEVHHVDGDYKNLDYSNYQVLCNSCHKLADYKLGRLTAGQKGLYTELFHIESIEFLKSDKVYDVEMNKPYHSLTMESGIVTSNSHSVAYAMTGYICQYLKVHYPIEFWTVALSKCSEDETSSYLSEIMQSGKVKVKGLDINKSNLIMSSDLETSTIYWGISSIKGIGEDTALQIINERNVNGDYVDSEDFSARHTFTGSKVKKQIYEALIASGCFDELYGLENREEERMDLINDFRTSKKVKIAKPERDIYTTGETSLNWWWKKQQKILTGLSLIDYSKIAKDYDIDTDFLTTQEFNTRQNYDLFRAFGGFVLECRVSRSIKGNYARLTIEHNYKQFKLMIWSDEYNKFKNKLKDCEKSIIVFSGALRFDSKYSNANQFTLKPDSDLVIL